METRTFWYVRRKDGTTGASTYSAKDSYKLKLEPGESLHRVDTMRQDMCVQYRTDDPEFDKRARQLFEYRDALLKPMRDALKAYEKTIDDMLMKRELPYPVAKPDPSMARTLESDLAEDR